MVVCTINFTIIIVAIFIYSKKGTIKKNCHYNYSQIYSRETVETHDKFSGDSVLKNK